MPEPKRDLLFEILSRRLGHARPWPVELSRHVARASAALGVDEMEWLRGVEGRSHDWAALVAAATVGHTSFFRHAEHFDLLVEQVAQLKRPRPVRLWSAGCSSGEEPWSIAVCLAQQGVEYEILATDVNPEAIAKARRGSYLARETEGLPGYDGVRPFIADRSLRSRVRFEVCALGQPLPADAPRRFDFVFCRNVLIYFDPDGSKRTLRWLADLVEPSGALVVAPVEALGEPPRGFRRVGPLGWLSRSADAGVRVPPRSLPASLPKSLPASLPKSLPASSQAPARSPSVAGVPRRASLPSGGAFEEAAHCVTEGRLDRAEHLLRELLTHSDDAFGWFLLGETFQRRGERVQARIAFERSTKATTSPVDMDLSTLRGAAARRALMLTD